MHNNVETVPEVNVVSYSTSV